MAGRASTDLESGLDDSGPVNQMTSHRSPEPGPSRQHHDQQRPADVGDRFARPPSPLGSNVTCTIPTTAGTIPATAGTVSTSAGVVQPQVLASVADVLASIGTVITYAGPNPASAGTSSASARVARPPPPRLSTSLPYYETFRAAFYRKFEEHNQTVFAKYKYEKMMFMVQKMKEGPPSMRGVLLHRFDIANVNGLCRLVDPPALRSRAAAAAAAAGLQLKIFVYAEEVFEAVSKHHGLTERPHRGRSVTYSGVSAQYRNISADVVRLYVDLCPVCRDLAEWAECEADLNVVAAQLLAPVPVPEMAKRYHVDVLDGSLPTEDGRFGNVLVGRDVRTGFVTLRPLSAGADAQEVALVLTDDVFAVFGPPVVLQTGHGRAFARQVVEWLSAIWPTTKMVDGDVGRRPPPHCATVSGILEIRRALSEWTRDNRAAPWTAALKYVQHACNRAPMPLPDGRWLSPNELMFRDPSPAWTNAPYIPTSMAQPVETEELLDDMIKLFNDTWNPDHGYGQRAPEQQAKDAISTPKVGDNVMVKLICLQTYMTHNVLGVVISIRGENAFELATSAGRVQQLCRRKQFVIINKQPPITISQLPVSKVINCRLPRSYEATEDIWCRCLKQCVNRKCYCMRLGKKCSSFCHNSHSCFNTD